MPDYRVYKVNEKGETIEVEPEEFAQFLGYLRMM